jgi:hypothetical protein
MPDLFGVTTHRIFYKAANFAAGKTVTAYLWSPAMVKSALQTLTEVSDGLYYLDYNFAATGAYLALFYEDGIKSIMTTFRVMVLPAASDIAVAVEQHILDEFDGEKVLQAILDKIETAGIVGVGSGPTAHTYTVTVDGVACADVLVNMSTDLAGTNYIHSGRTNALGKITFYPDLPSGTTVYLWRYKTGVLFTNPDVEVTT